MPKYLPIALSGLLTAAACIATPAAASPSFTSRITESLHQSFVQISQLYSDSGHHSINEKRGPLAKSDEGYGISKNVVTGEATKATGFPRALAAPGAPAATMAQADALSKGMDWMNANVGPVSAQIAEHLRTKGGASGVITYSEEVYITREEGGPVKMVLSFLMFVDKNGQPTYGSPVLIAADPDVLYATYTPLKVGDNLDETWQYPNPGTIQYQLLDSKGNEKTPLKVIDVRGAYDGQDGNLNGVDCLMDRTKTGCVDGGTDIKTLMHKNAATMAIVDYVNQMIPLYDEVPGSGGAPDYVPRGALSYTDRTWDCKMYGNVGQYGFVLEIRADRYYANLDESNAISYMLAETHKGRAISPVKDFSKEVPVSALPSNPEEWIISPLMGDATLFKLTDVAMKGIVYVAPVRLTGSTDVFDTASSYGDFGLGKGSDDGSGTKEYVLGKESDNTLSQGAYESTVEFQVSSPGDFEGFTLESVFFDDYLLMTLNDHVIYGGPDEPTIHLAWNQGKAYEETAYFPKCFQTKADPRGKWVCGDVAHGSETKGMHWGMYNTQFYCSDTDTVFINNNFGPEAWSCVKNFSFYKDCAAYSSTMGDGDGNTNQVVGCSLNNCAYVPPQLPYKPTLFNTVEYTLENGTKHCAALERNTNWRRTLNRDLTPYLQAGNNVIKVLSLVGDEGEMAARFRVQSCGAKLGFETGEQPPVPTIGTPDGLTEALINMRDQ